MPCGVSVEALTGEEEIEHVLLEEHVAESLPKLPLRVAAALESSGKTLVRATTSGASSVDVAVKTALMGGAVAGF